MTTVLTRVVARFLFPVALVTAAAILVKGYVDVGDGFSAGVLASFAFLIQYIAFGAEYVERKLPVRYAPASAFGGLLLVLLVGFLPLMFRRPLLSHYPPPDAEVLHFGTLELHTAVLFDVGVFFLILGFSVSLVRLVSTVDKELE